MLLNINDGLKKKVLKINRLQKLIESDMFSAFGRACAIGKTLLEIKNELPHGQFLSFISDHVNFLSRRSVQNYMKIYKNRETLQTSFKDCIKRYNLSYALYILGSRRKSSPSPEIAVTEKPQKLYLVKKIYTDMGYKISPKIKQHEQEDLKYPTKIEHTSFDEAIEEARRLSSLYGGLYMVFESIYYITSVEVKQEGRFN